MILRKPQTAVARAAFTLMEMLVVVAILVVLAGAAVPIYLSYLDSARLDRAKLDVKTLEGAAEAYLLNSPDGDYPQSLRQLLEPQPGRRASLTQESLIDPWRREYQIDTSQRHPTTGR